jgi:hypothetical protein
MVAVGGHEIQLKGPHAGDEQLGLFDHLYVLLDEGGVCLRERGRTDGLLVELLLELVNEVLVIGQLLGDWLKLGECRLAWLGGLGLGEWRGLVLRLRFVVDAPILVKLEQ